MHGENGEDGSMQGLLADRRDSLCRPARGGLAPRAWIRRSRSSIADQRGRAAGRTGGSSPRGASRANADAVHGRRWRRQFSYPVFVKPAGNRLVRRRVQGARAAKRLEHAHDGRAANTTARSSSRSSSTGRRSRSPCSATTIPSPPSAARSTPARNSTTMRQNISPTAPELYIPARISEEAVGAGARDSAVRVYTGHGLPRACRVWTSS